MVLSLFGIIGLLGLDNYYYILLEVSKKVCSILVLEKCYYFIVDNSLKLELKDGVKDLLIDYFFPLLLLKVDLYD